MCHIIVLIFFPDDHWSCCFFSQSLSISILFSFVFVNSNEVFFRIFLFNQPVCLFELVFEFLRMEFCYIAEYSVCVDVIKETCDKARLTKLFRCQFYFLESYLDLTLTVFQIWVSNLTKSALLANIFDIFTVFQSTLLFDVDSGLPNSFIQHLKL